MSDEQLRLLASTTINGLFSSGEILTPISAMDLLSRIISTGPPAGLFPESTPIPRFRLFDLPKCEAVLEGLAQNWEHGTLNVTTEGGEMTVMDVKLGTGAQGLDLAPRKRKRIVDEEADSADGNDEEGDSLEPGTTALGSLSKELKEVYAIMQKSTAKGRLLAEQVRIPELVVFLSALTMAPVSIAQQWLRTHMCANNQRRVCRTPALPSLAPLCSLLRWHPFPPTHTRAHGPGAGPLLLP